jgi:hypothetical protein
MTPELVLVVVLVSLLVAYLIPIGWVLLANLSHGGAKFGWFLIAVFFSWLGLAAFLIITQVARDRRNR